MLEIKYPAGQVSQSARIEHSVILHPCIIEKDAIIENCVIGPYVSIGTGTQILDSVIRNSIILNNSHIESSVIDNSMIGNFVSYKGKAHDLSMGDFSKES